MQARANTILKNALRDMRGMEDWAAKCSVMYVHGSKVGRGMKGIPHSSLSEAKVGSKDLLGTSLKQRLLLRSCHVAPFMASLP